MRKIHLHNPEKLIFGPGCTDQMVDDYIQSGKKRVFVLTVPPVLELLEKEVSELKKQGIQINVNTTLSAEPTFSDCLSLIEEARAFNADSIAGIGGGSVMDTAKLVAVFQHNESPLRENAGIGMIKKRQTHLVCVPTTSGTGSEVSPNSILIDEADGSKKGFISPVLVPDAAYVDPALTLKLPAAVTAYTGLDALTHCIEAVANKYAHPLVDTFALRGISLIADNLVTATLDGEDLSARSHVALGSMYGGMCLGPVNTAAVHALAYPLGTKYKVPHGQSNAMLLPYVMEFNLQSAPARYALIAQAMGVHEEAPNRVLAQLGLEKVKSIIEDCEIDNASVIDNIEPGAIDNLATAALEVQRLLKNNVREVEQQDAVDIYKKAFGYD